jgi:hypothetical protein
MTQVFSMSIFGYTLMLGLYSTSDIERDLAKSRERNRAFYKSSFAPVTPSREPSQIEPPIRDEPVTRQKRARARKPTLCPYCKENVLVGKQDACSPRCRKRKERLTEKKSAPSRKRSSKSAAPKTPKTRRAS